jgi:hypothetical protein
VQAAATPSVSARATYAQRGTNTLQHVFRDHFEHFVAEYDVRYAKDLGTFRLERISVLRHVSSPAATTARELHVSDARTPIAGTSISGLFLAEVSTCARHAARRGPCCSPSTSTSTCCLPCRTGSSSSPFPKALRVFLRYDQRLFGRISRLIFSLIAEFYSAAAAKPISSAAVLAYQPFGDALRFNPHFHALILDGGFDPEGKFYFLPIHDTAPLAQLLRQRTVGLFLKLGLITDQFAQTLLCWRHSGFSVDYAIRVPAFLIRAREALSQYIACPPLSLKKISIEENGVGTAISFSSDNEFFKGKTETFPVMRFFLELTQHIPPKGCQYIRRYGLYASRTKVRWPDKPHVVRLATPGWKKERLQASQDEQPYDAEAAYCVSDKESRSTWARLIAQVYEVDPLVCPRCSAPMRILAVITEPEEVRMILRHLVKIGRSPPGFDPSSSN